MLAVLAPLQLVIGDFHGLNTAKHQPAKVAAMEAHWDGSKPADLVLFAWPDAKAERNRFEVVDPEGREPDHHARPERALPRAQGLRARGPATGVAGVLLVPHHGGDRHAS